MALSDLETALTGLQAAAATLDTDTTAQNKTAAALKTAQDADNAAQSQLTSDKATLQTQFNALVTAAKALGLTVPTA